MIRPIAAVSLTVLLSAALTPARAELEEAVHLEVVRLCTEAGRRAGHPDTLPRASAPATEGGYAVTGHLGEDGAGFLCRVSAAMEVEAFELAPTELTAAVPDGAMNACAASVDEHWHVDTGISMPGLGRAVAAGSYEVEMKGPGRHCTCRVTADGRVLAVKDG